MDSGSIGRRKKYKMKEIDTRNRENRAQKLAVILTKSIEYLFETFGSRVS